MKEITNEQKQVILSGILGDGHVKENGGGSYSCIHKEYMDLKSKLLHNLALSPKKKMNSGYKKSPIYYLGLMVNPYGMNVIDKGIFNKLEDLDELGLALWFFDDGSRHKKSNFYNINTHSFSREEEEKHLIPLLNKFNIFPKIYTETKKDGRVFSYLMVEKWQGAMEMSRMMRKLNLECYDYKLLPKEMEDMYFEIKDTKEWNEISTNRRRTNYIKECLNVSHQRYIGDEFNTSEYINSDDLIF